MIIDPHNVLFEETDPETLLGSAGQLIADMDRGGVDLCGAYCTNNMVVVDAVKKYPDRIFGMAWAVPSDEGALVEVEKCLKEYKFKGLKLNMPKSLATLTPNSVMNDFYQILIDYDAVLLGHSTEGDHIFSMPYQFEQVARAFPKLKIIMAHIGTPDDCEEAIKVATWNKNVYLGSHAAPGSIIRKSVERAGAHKVVLGTDWPFEDFEVEIIKIEMAVPNPVDRKLVLGENSKRLFDIN